MEHERAWDVPGGPDHADAVAGLPRMRVRYARGRLLEADVAADPFTQLSRWLADAVASGLSEPNAVVLATASADGVPSTRHVLLKGMDAAGLVLFTNLRSRKSQDLASNPRASACFPWSGLERQVTVTGSVHEVARETVTAYWRSRPRESQIGAWASRQSQVVIGGRAALDHALLQTEERFPGEVPVPEFWGGWRISPDEFEFWQGGPSRMHDRLRYRRSAVAPAGWSLDRLWP